MISFTRGRFLRTSAALVAGWLAGGSFRTAKKNLPLSFSTLGCPDWSFQQILDFAAQHGYSGLELRGLQRQMDLTQCPEFNTAGARQKTMQLMKQHKLRFVNLGSSSQLHFSAGTEREKSLAEAKQFIDLAQQLSCPYVRVFPNRFPAEQTKEQTVELIANGLLELGNYAANKNVIVLMETHGDVVKIEDLKLVMQAAAHPNVGLVWDVANMWTITKEAPQEAYRELKNYIHHTHIKDARFVDGKLQYTFLGQGEVPIFEAMDLLRTNNYTGYYSFEWEKLWHPELAEPEEALADYPLAIKKHFRL